MSKRIFTSLTVISISLLILIVYRDLFSLWFTDIDTLPLIATGRIDSWSAFTDILSSPLMQGLMPNALFYRPLASITWGIDELVWGLNPLGYHLTDLALHIANSLLIYFFVRDLSEETISEGAKTAGADAQVSYRSSIPALLVALIFAIHPVGMEVVPAIARRPDLLFCLFLLLMLRSLAKALDSRSGKHIAWATLFSLLGFASKDTAIVLPGIAALFVVCFSPATSIPARISEAIRFCWPLFLVTGLFMIVRISVLDGLGGYPAADSFGTAAANSVYPFLCTMLLPGHLDACARMPLNLLVGIFAVVAAWIVVLCMRFRTDSRHNPASAFLLFGSLSLATLMLLYAASGTAATARTLYVALFFISLITGWGLYFICNALFSSSDGPDSKVGLRLMHGAAGMIFVAISCGIAIGAWKGQYINEWRLNAETSRKALTDLQQELDKVAPDSVVYLVNFPFLSANMSRPFRARPVFLEHTVQGFIDLAAPDKSLEVVALSFLRLSVDDPAELATSARYEPAHRRLDLRSGPGGNIQRKGWFTPYIRKTPWRDNSYEKPAEGDGLIIHLNPQLDVESRAVFFVYSGGRVTLHGTDAWSEISE